MLSSSASLRQKTHVPKPHNTGDNRCFLEKRVSCEKTYRKSNLIATRANRLREWIPPSVVTKKGEAQRRFRQLPARGTVDRRRRPVRSRLVCGSVGLVALHHGRQDAPELQDAEEAVTAGVAAVCGKPQPALHKNEGAGFHSLPRDVLEVKISAAGTMRVALQTGRHPPGVKAPVATVASPGPQTHQAG